jgi:CyaY protein
LAAANQTQRHQGAQAKAKQCARAAPYNGFLFLHGDIVMTDPEYLDLAETALGLVERTCDRLNDATDLDIDNQRVGGMVTLTFANRSQIVINLQPPLHELWMATRTGGYHYRWQDNAWRDTKTGQEFFADLAQHMSAQVGAKVVFEA